MAISANKFTLCHLCKDVSCAVGLLNHVSQVGDFLTTNVIKVHLAPVKRTTTINTRLGLEFTNERSSRIFTTDPCFTRTLYLLFLVLAVPLSAVRAHTRRAEPEPSSGSFVVYRERGFRLPRFTVGTLSHTWGRGHDQLGTSTSLMPCFATPRTMLSLSGHAMFS
jgi:hypothetical protein